MLMGIAVAVITDFASAPGNQLTPPPTIAPTPIVQSMAQSVKLPSQSGNSDQDRFDQAHSYRNQGERAAAALSADENSAIAIIPGDPRRHQQWNFFEPAQYKGASALFAAHAHSSGNYPVVVAVVDSGLMLDHVDLEILSGFDFVSQSKVANDGDGRDDNPSDPGDWVTAEEITGDPVSRDCTPTTSKWHGTAVAGIIGAISDNQRGISGGAPSVLLLPVRVTGKCGGFIKDLVDGVRWSAGLPVAGAPANNSPARVINLSVGFPGDCPTSLQNAIDDAVDAGAIVVVAATNTAAALDTDPQSPASCTNVTTVGALLRDGRRASYSAFGSAVSIMAPGGSISDGIITTQNASATTPETQSSYGFHFGTSMAAAHVSATYATLLGIDPSLTNGQLRQLISVSASGPGSIAGCSENMCGAGRLNAKSATDQLLDLPIDATAAPSEAAPADDATSVVSTLAVAQPPTPTTAAASDTETSQQPASTGSGAIQFADLWLLLGLLLSSLLPARHRPGQTMQSAKQGRMHRFIRP